MKQFETLNKKFETWRNTLRKSVAKAKKIILLRSSAAYWPVHICAVNTIKQIL
jgi:hypothetical protein